MKYLSTNDCIRHSQNLTRKIAKLFIQCTCIYTTNGCLISEIMCLLNLDKFANRSHGHTESTQMSEQYDTGIT